MQPENAMHRQTPGHPDRIISDMMPAQRETSGRLSKQHDWSPSFSSEHTTHHLTTNYYCSRVTAGCFHIVQFVTVNTKQITAGTTLRVKPASAATVERVSSRASQTFIPGCVSEGGQKVRRSTGNQEADSTRPVTAAADTLPGFRGRTTINPAEAARRDTRRKKRERE